MYFAATIAKYWNKTQETHSAQYRADRVEENFVVAARISCVDHKCSDDQMKYNRQYMRPNKHFSRDWFTSARALRGYHLYHAWTEINNDANGLVPHRSSHV